MLETPSSSYPASDDREPAIDRPARTLGRPRRRRRWLALAALVALLALVGSACKQLDPNNRAVSVPGVTNGKLPISYLASTSNGCVVYDEAINSLKEMIAQAAKDGVKLRGIGCYRDYNGQVAVREDWCGRGQCAMAAVPGTSNHGWGKAVDFADQSGELTFDSAGYKWLKQWAGHYGWMHPLSMEPNGSIPEPWHWEWIGDGGKMFNGEYFGIGNGPLAEPRGLPFGFVDEWRGGQGEVVVSGWAIDPDQVASIPVHVYVDSVGVAVTANRPRTDVGNAFPLYAGAPHGFTATIPASAGVHRVCVYALNVTGTGWNRLLECRDVTVTAPSAPKATPAPEARSVAPTTSTTTPAPTTPSTTVPQPTTTTSTATTSTTAAPSTTTTAPAQGGAGGAR